MDHYEMSHDGSTFAIGPPEGEAVGIELMLPPGVAGPPEHAHRAIDERYRVLEGVLEVKAGGTWRRLEAGDALEVPRGTAHTFRNASRAPVRFVTVHTPGARFAEYMREMGRLSARGHIGRLPGALIPLSVVWNRYPDCFRATSPLQRLVMNLLDRVGRLSPALREG